MEIDLVENELPPDLRDLVATCLERMEQEGAQALESVCREHPEHADALRRRVEALHKMGFVEIKGAPQAFPEKLGEFRLIRQLGGGGMGVVYLAEQESLGRRVALKLIRPENMYFPGARDRFRREVEAVAKLQHSGIVPVYTVGEANGVPYFAMEHVDGKTIAECVTALRDKKPETLTADDLSRVITERAATDSAIRESRSSSAASVFRGRWVQVCLRVAREVAASLAHAHERGVLHRDIKPSNVMITREGRVLLLDFGLAISQDATRLTRSGSLVGSLPYMAPEQVQGNADAVGPTTDVYSLGVTLYEMLTLRLPYANSIADEVQRAIVDGQAEPPSRINPAIPWDVETVCLTAMDAEPGRRYASAEAFARDLTNVLELRPIEARRPGPLLRVRRFVQRHPARSLGIVFGVLLLVGGPTVWGLLERSRRLEREALNVKLEAALRESTTERERAERNFASALRAVDQMLAEVGENELAEIPLMEGVRRRLLEQALDFYRSFLAEPGADDSVARRVAEGHERMGRILVLLGRREEGGREFEEAIRGHEALLARAPASGGVRATAPNGDELEIVRARLSLGELLREAGDLKQSEVALVAVRSATDRLLAAFPNDAATRMETARTRFEGSRLAMARGELADAEASAMDAIEIAAPLDSHDPMVARQRATWWNEIGLMIMGVDASYPSRAKEIEDAFRASIAALDLLTKEQREHTDTSIMHATAVQDLAGHFRRLERFDEAEALYVEAQSEIERVVDAHPERVEARRQLAHVINNRGLVAELTHREADAERLYGEVVARLDELVRAVPGVADLVANLGVAWMNFAYRASLRGDPAMEAERLTNARKWLTEARRMNPENPSYAGVLGNVLNGLCKPLEKLGRHAEIADAVVELQALAPDNANRAMKAAVGFARCCVLVRADPALDDAAKDATCADYAKRAIPLLDRAKELGIDAFQTAAKHPDFAPLREIHEFRAALRERGVEVPEAGD